MDSGEKDNDWENATLKTYLNGEYLNSIRESAKIAKYNNEYSKWYLKGLTGQAHTNAYAPEWYLGERYTGQPGYKGGTQYAAKAEINAAVGLMYPSDYGYAAYGTTCDNKSTMTLDNYVEGCAAVNWLAQYSLDSRSDEWLVSPNPSGSAFRIAGYANGFVKSAQAYLMDEYAVRPTVYLEADTKIYSGTGAKSNPYQITTLSEMVLAKVSDTEYTSSQDSSLYKIIEPKAYNYNQFSESQYGSVNISAYKYSSTNLDAERVEITDDIFTFSNGTWYSKEITDTITDVNATIDLTGIEAGDYQLCYNIDNDSPSTIITAHVKDSSGNTTNTVYAYNSGCADIGRFQDGYTINIVYYQPLDYYAPTNFYLKEKISQPLSGVGVRYQGMDPDNYVKFNGNEEWRIIGVFDGQSIGLDPDKQYTKIIKSTSIGDYMWDCESTEVGSATGGTYCRDYAYENDWTNSTLNKYLNGDYLNSMSDKGKIAKYNNQYSTWYLRGHDTSDLYPYEMFLYERTMGKPGYRNRSQYKADTETTGAIGLMYPSDYGFATYVYNDSMLSGEYKLSEYDYVSYYNWLSSKSFSYFITPATNSLSSAYAIGVNSASGTEVGINDITSYFTYSTYPTLYLEANISATGTGSKSDPYVLK